MLLELYFMKKKEAHARSLLKEIHSLKVYQINILQILTFMQKVENTTIPRVFSNTFEEIDYKYQTRFSKYNFKQPLPFINCAKFSVFSRGPQLWNRILYFSNLVIFKVQIKEKLLSTDNELDYF